MVTTVEEWSVSRESTVMFMLAEAIVAVVVIAAAIEGTPLYSEAEVEKQGRGLRTYLEQSGSNSSCTSLFSLTAMQGLFAMELCFVSAAVVNSLGVVGLVVICW